EQIKKLIYPDIVGNAKSFVAGIFLLPPNSKINLTDIICKSLKVKPKELNPPFLKDGVASCSEDTVLYK
ncbi:hypothetical protein, partial [Gloeomargarita lithophora]|uniref:hypothetical protein n=1 Tax=Gloeomargarita lithophora TaxID=1188228 RepID=UPI003F715F6E